ncbi:MAG: hypothetical protein HYR55_16490 [Acidobacteria bacterium]|nr:hypothetical protein [Acidobacteriota bacterium]MBI3656575.1 hypothetical protein [Acidobacteriota bacterium]
MGNCYTSVFLHGPDPYAVYEYLVDRLYNAYVLPAPHNITVVCEEGCNTQEQGTIVELTRVLSANFHCPALGLLNHDDDWLWFVLCENGKTVGKYNSKDRRPIAAGRLQQAFGSDASRGWLWFLLKIPHPLFLFEIYRHRWLARALELPPWSVGLSYTPLADREIPSGLTESDIKCTRAL